MPEIFQREGAPLVWKKGVEPWTKDELKKGGARLFLLSAEKCRSYMLQKLTLDNGDGYPAPTDNPIVFPPSPRIIIIT